MGIWNTRSWANSTVRCGQTVYYDFAARVHTLAAPKFKDGEQLRTYDYVVANPPFSDKTWSTGLTLSNDSFQRFTWGEPPGKQGDYTYLLPHATRMEVARAYTASKVGWIRAQQAKLFAQARETPRSFVTRESHYLWGKRYLLTVVERDEKPRVTLDHRRITQSVRPGSPSARRAAVMHEWHKALLHEAVPPLIAKWEAKADVAVEQYFLQRMKTKWGGCNARARTIRLNTELVRKPKDLLDYVVAHEVFHLIGPTHNERFVALLDRHYPTWREARGELNELPLAAENWP